MGEAPTGPVLEVKDLRTHLFTSRGVGRAVDGVSFALRRGETLGLVGESGSGKSLTCLSLLRLNPQPASRIVGGAVLYEGTDLLAKTDEEMRRYRGKRIALVLQDPMTALNPVFTVGNQIFEAIRLHQGARGSRLRKIAAEMMRLLRIPDPEQRLGDYPHQFSGGMRQRAVGAIALSGKPSVLIADEPTTALDVTIQAAYLEVLKEIQRRERLAILFVTHDFAVVARMCDRVAVMYAGKIVETADTWRLFDDPRHPYTVALLRSVPDVEARIERLYAIEGQPPSVFEPAKGCAFAARCPHAEARCHDEPPPDVPLEGGRAVRCWLFVR
ncbi:MAG: ABC transporter ATP-binding protein [Proteobacteria bacterium]|nr:ABC transporter ATP-binding protein [Pseudomonadota bacterium]